MKHYWHTLGILSLVSATLSGCVTIYPAISDQQRARLDAIEIHFARVADVISVEYERSGVGAVAAVAAGPVGAIAGGAIDATVNRERRQLARDAASPYIAMLDGYQISGAVKNSFERLTSNGHEPTFLGPYPLKEKQSIKTLLRNSDSGALVTTQITYGLTRDLKILEVAMDYQIRLSRSVSGDPKDMTSLYRSALYQSLEREWTKSSLIEEMERGAQHVIALMALDISDSRKFSELKQHKRTLSLSSPHRKIYTANAWQIGESEEGSLGYFRLSNSQFVAAAPQQVIRIDYIKD